MTTKFTLGLNTALTLVLTQHGGGTTTCFLPGIGQQVGSACAPCYSNRL